jgi:hypothetical protein
MKTLMRSADVRKNWSETINSVIRQRPLFIQRNRDRMAFMSIEQLQLLLDPFKLTIRIATEENGSFTGVIEELDLLENASSISKLKIKLINELFVYCEEYMTEFQKYYHSTNRRKHFPYIYKALAYEDRIMDVVEIYKTDDTNA